ncbi:hypothetical protein [Microbacterium sp. LWH3-1.2]|uniref:hypothetical protein n=1 Tax=Microbacterium sp. LWH3-1.2 TaxID=3135256 RepID=UPI003437DF54
MSLDVGPLTLGTSPLARSTDPGSSAEDAAVAFAEQLLESSHAFIDTPSTTARPPDRARHGERGPRPLAGVRDLLSPAAR